MEFNETAEVACANRFTNSFSLALLLLALPCHLLILKILIFNFRFDSSRHIILCCLSVSDSLQMIASSFFAIVVLIGRFEDRTSLCVGLRYMTIFISVMTFIVSSLTLVALSVERYIACFHSYRIHEWLTSKRVITALIVFWVSGTIGGGFSCIQDSNSRDQFALLNSSYLEVILMTTAIPVSAILVIVQSMLLYLSRKKLRGIQPTSTSSSSQDDENSLMKRQVKIAVVAGAVVLSYLICSLPGMFLVIYRRIGHSRGKEKSLKIAAIGLGSLNTLLNPFIYGLGMLDTRKEIWKELRKIRNTLLSKFGMRDDLDA